MISERSLLSQLEERVENDDFFSAENIVREMRASGYPASLMRIAEAILDRDRGSKRNIEAALPGGEAGVIIGESPKLSGLEIKELKAFGSAILGPCMALFYRRLATKTSYTHQPPKNLYFLAREGYLMQRGYDALKAELKAPADSKYLIASRVLVFRALLGDPRVLPLICSHNFSGTLKVLLQSRCGLDQKEVQVLRLDANLFPEGLLSIINLPSDASQVAQLFEQNAIELKSYASKSNEAYLLYLHELGVMEEEPIHIVDLGYSGTIQKCLSILTGKKVVGHYLITTPAARNTPENTFIGHIYGNMEWKAGCSILDRSLILEALLTAPNGSARGIRRTAEGTMFEFGPETISQKYFSFIECIFEGCLEYCKLNNQNNNSFLPWEVNAFYDLMTCARNSPIPPQVLRILEVEDCFSGLGIINPSETYGNQL